MQTDWPRHKIECKYLSTFGLWPKLYEVPANVLKCNANAIDRVQKKSTASAKGLNNGARTAQCAICAASDEGQLQKTPCCGALVCDRDAEYKMGSYARTSCLRNHDRYTTCASHCKNCLTADWRDCKACKEEINSDANLLWCAVARFAA